MENDAQFTQDDAETRRLPESAPVVETRRRFQVPSLLVGFVVLILLVAALVMVVPNLTKNSAAVNANQKNAVKIVLQWLPNVEFSGLWWGIEKGWFDQKNVHVAEFLPWSDGVDPVQLVASGKYDFGVNDGAAVAIARAQGVKVRAVYCAFQTTPFGFATLKNRKDGKQLLSMKDLRGMKVGYQSHELYLLEEMLAYNQMTMKDIVPVEVGFDPAPLYTLGPNGEYGVDAYLVFKSNEPIVMKLNGIETNVIDAAQNGFDFYGDCLFTRDDFIAQNPDTVKNFVSVYKQGWQYALTHQDETVTMVTKKYFPAQSDDQKVIDNNAKQQAGELAEFAVEARSGLTSDDQLGTMTADRWANGLNILKQYNQIDSIPDAKDVFTNDYLK